MTTNEKARASKQAGKQASEVYKLYCAIADAQDQYILQNGIIGSEGYAHAKHELSTAMCALERAAQCILHECF